MNGADLIGAFGAIFFLVILWGMYQVHRSEKPYDLSDLVTTGNRYDLDKVGKLTALLTTTWIVVHMELRGATVEWALTLYAVCWIGASVASLVARIKGGGSIPQANNSATTPTETPIPPRGS